MNGVKERVIFHIDLDYFYAQVEERDNPELRDKPVVVCVYSGRGGDSGAVATANYVARRYGVKAGIPIKRAKELLKEVDAVFLPMRRDYYSSISEEVMDIIRDYGDAFEQVSIDEAYIDVTGRVGGDFDKAREYALKLKDEIRSKVGLTCSIGVAPNKLVAKIASGYKKPDGLTVVKPEEVESFLAELPIDEIPGIGKKTSSKLREMGVEKIKDLRELDQVTLIRLFGEKIGAYIYLAARGIDNEPVVERVERQQYSRIITLKNNTRNVEEIYQQIKPLIGELNERLEREKKEFRTLSVILITTDLKTRTKSITLPTYTARIENLDDKILELIREFIQSTELEVRRAGLRVSGLRPIKTTQSKLTQFF